MAAQSVMVDQVQRLDPRPAQFAGGVGRTTVYLAGGGTCLLDLADPRSATWYSALETLRQAGLAAYIETDPKTNIVSRVLVARTLHVVAVAPKPIGNQHRVDLMISQTPHFIHITNPHYQRLLTALIAAQQAGTPVLVTEEPAEPAVIDVRPSLTGLPVVPAEPAPRAPSPRAVVTPQRARELFDLVANQTCVASTSFPPTCIAFLYPDNGCWARAHEMCRLMIDDGASPGKTWLYADLLEVETRNHPNCQVHFTFHAAPTLLVETEVSSEVWVIDPALFTGPVPMFTWVAMQNPSGATIQADTDAQAYMRSRDGSIETDPNFIKTNLDLAGFRVRLDVRCRIENPPGPPYGHCP